MEKPDISIVICTYNRAKILRFALESVIKQETNGEFSYDIIVIDDASTDATERIIWEIRNRSNVPIKYLRERGAGIAIARNRGVKESNGDWIAFTDDDQLVEPIWLKELYELALSKKTDCVGGSRRLYLNEGELSQISNTCRLILGEIDFGNKPIKCRRKQYPGTGNVLLKKTVFDVVGCFDESLNLGGEDYDFFQRVWKAGFESWYSPSAIVNHITPAYRLKENYLLWTSLRNGENFASTDFKIAGKIKTLLLCAARIGQALLVHIPLLTIAILSFNSAEKLGRRCLIARAIAYTRKTLYLFYPNIFSQKCFFSHLEFRRERSIFLKYIKK